MLVLSISGEISAQEKRDSVRIYFHQGKVNIDTCLLDNGNEMERFAKICSALNDSVRLIRKIQIIGGASPEGGGLLNGRLSEKRAEVLWRYISPYIKIPVLEKDFHFSGSDWNGLITMVRADVNVPEREDVLRLLEKIVRLENQDSPYLGGELKRLKGGRPYSYLYKFHFPKLRSSMVKICYDSDPINPVRDTVTVFTPVYNRKNLIGNLYQSLLSQTYKNFEWIIVDDGSTDDIDEIIKSYQNEDRILIRFIKQENGGKHRAINNGVLHAKGELFYIVDSDDYLTKDSIERIVFHYQYIKNNDKFAGVCGMKCFPDGSRIGKEVTWKILKDSWINYWIIKNIKGDVAFVFKTSVLRNYLFDDIPGEKFCAESLVLNRIGKNYLMLFFNEKIYIAEYLSDGLSVSSIKNRMNSPNYAMRIYSEMASLDIPYLKKIKAHINYWRFAPCSKLKMKNKIKQIGISSYIIFMPIGYLFHMKDKKNNYIDIRHVGSKR